MLSRSLALKEGREQGMHRGMRALRSVVRWLLNDVTAEHV